MDRRSFATPAPGGVAASLQPAEALQAIAAVLQRAALALAERPRLERRQRQALDASGLVAVGQHVDGVGAEPGEEAAQVRQVQVYRRRPQAAAVGQRLVQLIAPTGDVAAYHRGQALVPVRLLDVGGEPVEVGPDLPLQLDRAHAHHSQLHAVRQLELPFREAILR